MKGLRLSADVAQGLRTVAVAGSGALVFLALGIPAGAVLGGMTATAAASLAGVRLGFPKTWRAPQLAIMGLAAGATVTPATLAAAGLWPGSLLVLLIGTVAIHGLAYWLFRRLTGADRLTSYFATAPGSLSAIMVLAEDHDCDLPRIAVTQTLRVVILLGLAPLALSGAGGAAPQGADPGWLQGAAAWGVLAAACVVGWGLARRLGWPIPAFLGVMLGSAILHATNLVGVHPPAWLLSLSMAALGGVIGARFSGLGPRDVAGYLPGAFATLAASLAVAAPLGWIVGTTVGVGSTAGLIAFAPGSMEVMIAVSIALGAQPTYVACHHVARTLFLLATVPAIARRLPLDRRT